LVGSGGLIYANSALSLLFYKINIQTVTAAVNGGLAYVSVIASSITMNTASISGVQALTGMGGLMYIASTATGLVNFQITSATMTNVNSVLSGSIIYSQTASTIFLV
jgi:hypothetical protein